MAKARKHRFPTWSDAELNEEVSRKSLNVHEVALRELVRGRVTWIKSEVVLSRKVGVCALEEAHGGVVILVEAGMISPYYVDEWCFRVRQQTAPPTCREYMPEYKSWIDIRQIADRVKEMQMEVSNRLAREGASPARTAIAPEVDHIPRSI